MIKKLLLILCIGYLPIYFQGCGCGTDNYRTIDCKLLVLDNTGQFPVMVFDSVVSKKALGFRFQKIDTVANIGYDMKVDLGYSCYAFSCYSDIVYINKISRVKITTLNDYSNQIGANSVITSLFSPNHSITDLDGFLKIEDLSYQGDVFLFDTTALPHPQKFQFEIEFSDGLKVNTQSPNLTLR